MHSNVTISSQTPDIKWRHRMTSPNDAIERRHRMTSSKYTFSFSYDQTQVLHSPKNYSKRSTNEPPSELPRNHKVLWYVACTIVKPIVWNFLLLLVWHRISECWHFEQTKNCAKWSSGFEWQEILKLELQKYSRASQNKMPRSQLVS